MPPRKNQPKNATVKAKPAPAKPTAKTEPAAAPAVVAPQAPKFTAGDLVTEGPPAAPATYPECSCCHKRASVHQRVPSRRSSSSRSTLSDGTVLHATGKHADVMVRFSNECQEICQTQGLAAYNGPPLTHYTAEEWAAKNA